MSNISVRLTNELADRLEREAEIRHQKRSELIREAVHEYLQRCEQDRFLAEMVSEAQAAYSNPEFHRDALNIEAEFSAAEDSINDDDDPWWQ